MNGNPDTHTSAPDEPAALVNTAAVDETPALLTDRQVHHTMVLAVVLGLVGYFVVGAAAIVIAGIITVLFTPEIVADPTLLADPGVLEQTLLTGPVIVTSMIAGWVGLLGPIAIGLARIRHNVSPRTYLRWAINWRTDLLIAVVVAFVLRLWEAFISVVLTWVGVDLTGVSNTDIVTTSTGVWLPIVILGATIGAPIIEEVFFRGAFLTTITSRYGNAAGIIITSIVFGWMHAQGGFISGVVIATQIAIVGAVLAWLVIRTGRLGTAILAHVMFNVSGVVLAFLALT